MTAPRFALGDRVRLAGSPGFTGTVIRHYKPMSSGKRNVLVSWDRDGDYGTVLESQLEAIR